MPKIKKPTLRFPDRLRAWRAAQGITREQAADVLGVPLRTLESWELARRGKRAEIIISVITRLSDDGF
jgi:transcriptional regulator with XRE-family HTH domain